MTTSENLIIEMECRLVLIGDHIFFTIRDFQMAENFYGIMDPIKDLVTWDRRTKYSSNGWFSTP